MFLHNSIWLSSNHRGLCFIYPRPAALANKSRRAIGLWCSTVQPAMVPEVVFLAYGIRFRSCGCTPEYVFHMVLIWRSGSNRLKACPHSGTSMQSHNFGFCFQAITSNETLETFLPCLHSHSIVKQHPTNSSDSEYSLPLPRCPPGKSFVFTYHTHACR